MRAGRKKYFPKVIFAASCNSFKLSLGTLENNLKPEQMIAQSKPQLSKGVYWQEKKMFLVDLC